MGAVLILFFAMSVASLLLVAAVVGPGSRPKAALVLAVVFFIVDSIPGLPGGELVALATGLITFGWIACRIVRLTESATASHSTSQFGSVPERTP